VLDVANKDLCDRAERFRFDLEGLLVLEGAAAAVAVAASVTVVATGELRACAFGRYLCLSKVCPTVEAFMDDFGRGDVRVDWSFMSQRADLSKEATREVLSASEEVACARACV